MSRVRQVLSRGGVLLWVLVAIVLALALGSVRVGGHHLVPVAVGRVFATFSDVFSQFLSFAIPLIIVGLVTPAIVKTSKNFHPVYALTVQAMTLPVLQFPRK